MALITATAALAPPGRARRRPGGRRHQPVRPPRDLDRAITASRITAWRSRGSGRAPRNRHRLRSPRPALGRTSRGRCRWSADAHTRPARLPADRCPPAAHGVSTAPGQPRVRADL